MESNLSRTYIVIVGLLWMVSLACVCGEPPEDWDESEDADTINGHQGADALGGTDTSGGTNEAGIEPPFRDAHASWTHLCAIAANDRAFCWRQNTGLRDWDIFTIDNPIQVSAGENFACVLDADNRSHCEGTSNWPTPTPNEQFDKIAAGRYHACGLSAEGFVQCWGNREEESLQRLTPDGGPYLDITAGDGVTCAIRQSDDHVECFGSGDPDPVTEAPELALMAVDIHSYYTCGLDFDGEPHCWGSPFVETPTDLGDGYVSIAVGAFHACALDESGQITCWGLDLNRQGGTEGNGQLDVPPGTYAEVVTGGYFSCAVDRDDELPCWGGHWDEWQQWVH